MTPDFDQLAEQLCQTMGVLDSPEAKKGSHRGGTEGRIFPRTG